MRKLCIFHAGCNDGFGAAWAIWKRYGDEFEYHPAVHGAPPPPVDGRDVVMVDFAYPRAVFADIVAKAKSVLVLDHHIGMVTELAPWLDASSRKPANIEEWGWNGVCVMLNMYQSGAMLAWRFFHPEDTTAPILTMLIEDYDLYRLERPGSKELAFALASYPQDFWTWDAFYVPDLIKQGTHICRFMRKQIDDAKANAKTMRIAGIDVPAANTAHIYANDVAGEMSEGHPFAACYWVTNAGTKFSLRSQKDGMDVSVLARRYGGGGHKHAAGFTLPEGVSL